MKKLLVSAAVLALFAAPALAQQNDDHHGRGNRDQGGNPPRAMSVEHPDRNPNHGNMGGGAQTVAPAAQPAPLQSNSAMMQHNDGNNDRGRGGGGMRGPQAAQTPVQPAPQVTPQQQPNSTMMGGNDRNYGSGANNRGGNNRGDNNRFDNNRGGMSGPNYNRNQMGGNRAQNFNTYHRNFDSARRYRAPSIYRRPTGWYSHRWTFGERLPSAFFVRNYWIDDFYDYGLMNPPYGTVWVRYGADALLIDRYSGEVIQVVYRVFY